jgi:hypothetical protein
MANPFRGATDRAFVTGVVFAAALAGGCYAGVGYADDGYDDAPPVSSVETSEPFYFEGHPNYWYRGHWHYREGGRWRRYRSEPEPMRQWRVNRRPPPPAATPPRPLPPRPEPGRPGPGRPEPLRPTPSARPGPGRPEPPRGEPTRPQERGREQDRDRR